MKKFKILFYIIWLLIIALFQPTLVQWIGIFGVSPDLFLIFVICAAMLRGMWDGAICGFVFGLTLDMIIGRMIGMNAILYMYAGLMTGVLNERYISSNSATTDAVFVFANSLLCGILYFAAYKMVWGDLGFITAFLKTILPKAVYSAVVAFVLFIPMRKSFGLIKVKRLF